MYLRTFIYEWMLGRSFKVNLKTKSNTALRSGKSHQRVYLPIMKFALLYYMPIIVICK